MITAAADGSSLANPGPAGWAWYIDDDRWAAGGWPHGTNNMGELMAVLDLLNSTAGTDEELLGLCDRIYTLSYGRITGEVERADATQEILMSHMMQES